MRKIKLGANLIFFGSAALEAMENIESENKRVLIVENGSILKEVGFEQELLTILTRQGFTYQVFNEVGPEPRYSELTKGAMLANAFQPDWIIGFGGGSAMDAAKIIWVLYENPELDTMEKLATPNNIRILRKKAHLCCIATTAGTGSEVTRAAVFTDELSHRKIAIADSVSLRLVPDIAVLDPRLTMTMPASLTAATGMDVVTHAVEAYLSRTANVFSSSLALEAFKLAYANLGLSYEQPKEFTYKENMLAASSMAGIAFSNSGLGVCHSLAHVIGAKYRIAHGLANAVLLPYVLQVLNTHEQCQGKIAELAKAIDQPELIKAIAALNQRLAIPENFHAYRNNGYDWKEHLEDIVDLAIMDSNTKNSPIELTREEFKNIVVSVFE